MTGGALLKRFRQDRTLTLRELGRLSDVDHAYIHRLETGQKDTPSDKTVQALSKALRLDSRQASILRCLIEQDAPDELVAMMFDEPDYALADFKAVVALSRRGTRSTTTIDWQRRLHRVRELREEWDGRG